MNKDAQVIENMTLGLEWLKSGRAFPIETKDRNGKWIDCNAQFPLFNNPSWEFRRKIVLVEGMKFKHKETDEIYILNCIHPSKTHWALICENDKSFWDFLALSPLEAFGGYFNEFEQIS